MQTFVLVDRDPIQFVACHLARPDSNIKSCALGINFPGVQHGDLSHFVQYRFDLVVSRRKRFTNNQRVPHIKRISSKSVRCLLMFPMGYQ